MTAAVDHVMASAAGPLPPARHEWDLEPKLEIWVEGQADPVVVTVAGELTGDVAYRLRDVLAPLVGAPGRRVVLDIAEVVFIDAGGIGVLVGARHRARARGSGFVVVNVRPSVRRALEMTGLADLVGPAVISEP